MDIVNFAWGQDGISMFDQFSLHHAAWLFLITTILYAMKVKKPLLWVLFITIGWEISEYLLVTIFNNVPFAGHERFINKCIGDPISNFIGAFISIWAVRIITMVNLDHLRKKAFALAKRAHSEQKYSNGIPYLAHLMHVTSVLEQFGFSPSNPDFDKGRAQKLAIMAILHDILEDTYLSYDYLKKEFGSEVADGVFAVTKVPYVSRDESWPVVYEKINKNKDALIIKLCDRYANILFSMYGVKNKKYLNMYKQEWPEFKKALYTENSECDEIWKELGRLIEEN